MSKQKIIVVGLFLLAVALFFSLDAGQYLNLDYLKAERQALAAYQADHPLQTALIFFSAYILITGVSLPGAAVLTRAGGALFGLALGTLLVSFGSVIGATIAFLLARYLFRDYVQRKFGARLLPINRGIEREGNLYLFTIRLIPVFPFFMVNVLMALTPIRTLNFALVSQAGMLLPTLVFVNAGAQLAALESPGDVFSPQLLLAFALLGLFPLLAKRTLTFIRRRRETVETGPDV